MRLLYETNDEEVYDLTAGVYDDDDNFHVDDDAIGGGDGPGVG